MLVDSGRLWSGGRKMMQVVVEVLGWWRWHDRARQGSADGSGDGGVWRQWSCGLVAVVLGDRAE